MWNESTIVYHIYPRSFKDSNQDGIGDLEGIIQSLNYLNGDKLSLGVDAIWLSPIYPSPQKDFGYDVADYKNIDPIFGDLDNFKKLIKEADNKGIKVMMDFVPNHTSLEHPWFKEARRSKNNPKRDFYIWADPKEEGGPPNNWLSVFGGSGWEFDKETGQYYFHSFDISQPDLNLRNPKVVGELLDVLRFWLEIGIDGFRVDAVEHMFKDPLLRDEPSNPVVPTEISSPYESLIHIYTFGQPEVLEMIKKFVEVLESYDNKFLVTEVWSQTQEIVKMYGAIGKKWFAPFNFGLIVQPWRANAIRRFVDHYDQMVGALYTPTYVLGNHDRHRVASRIGRQQTRIAAILLLTLRGMPYIYFGDELGMEDGEIPADRVADPYEKNSPGLGLGRDPERTPMQWNAGEFAGFSEVEPWLPVAKNFKEVNVEVENNDQRSLLSLYKKLISLRKTSKALQFGKYQSLSTESEEVFVYSRTFEEEIILVILNFSSEEQKISMPFSHARVIFDSSLLKEGTAVKLDQLNILANEGLVVQI